MNHNHRFLVVFPAFLVLELKHIIKSSLMNLGLMNSRLMSVDEFAVDEFAIDES